MSFYLSWTALIFCAFRLFVEPRDQSWAGTAPGDLRLSFCAANVADHLMALINVGSHAANHADALHTGTNAVRWNQADRQV